MTRAGLEPQAVAGHVFYSDGTCGRCGLNRWAVKEKGGGYEPCRRDPTRRPAGGPAIYDWKREGDFLGFRPQARLA